jgi:alpha-aminoadipate carrier protein LysW
MIACLACEADIDVDEDELDEGDTITCDECGADMRVVGVKPLELESLEEEEDDAEGAGFEEDEEDDDFQK